MINIIFIDIDGVLISDNDNTFNVNALQNLKYIVKKSNAKLVLSSTWRLHKKPLEHVKNVLSKYDMELFSTTAINKYIKPRSDEILEFIENISSKINVNKWIAIDDAEILTNNKENFFRIDPQYGLTQDDAHTIINMFQI